MTAPTPDPGASAAPVPGDLYLDAAVPVCERVTVSRNGWSAAVTHVWTGTGWARLVPGAVRAVPTHPVVPAPAPTRAARRAGAPAPAMTGAPGR